MSNVVAWAGAALLLFAGWSAYDLRAQETRTLVVYATPALRDFLENDVLPRFENRTGLPVQPIYVAAGEQYNRLKMSGSRPEAGLFLHASPLFIEKGYAEGYFAPFQVNATGDGHPLLRSRAVEGGVLWRAFAWSPLVEVYGEGEAAPPDLAAADLPFGLAHPRLSNNGVYIAAFFESVSPGAGRHALDRTTVQPVNARATIQGVMAGSFAVTLGYEAVVRFYQAQGARVAYADPVVNGTAWTLPVVFSVGLVHGPPRPGALEFIDHLFHEETQSRLEAFHFRSAANTTGETLPGLAPDARPVRLDWSRWQELEAALARYEVGP